MTMDCGLRISDCGLCSAALNPQSTICNPQSNMPEWKAEIRRRVAGLKLAPTREAAIVEELAQHLDDCYAELLAGGATEAEAYRAALAELSESELLARELRRVERQFAPEPIILGTNRRTKMIADLWPDLRFGARMLLKQPGFTVAAILSLALGIGAATAIFSFVDAVLLRPLPYPQPDRLVELREVNDRGRQVRFAEPNYSDVRDNVRSFDSITQYTSYENTVNGANEPARARVAVVSGGFFKVLGVQPQAGRSFLPEESKPGGTPVAVISHGFWQRLLGGKTDFSNTSLKIDNLSYTVVGVMPPGFDFPNRSAVWIARELTPVNSSRTAHNWSVIARLGEGVSLTAAKAEVSALGRRLKQQFGKDIDAVDFALIPQHEFLVRDVKSGLWLIGGAVALLLLIACANVANLLLAQATARQQELSVRQALGASGFRLLRQFVTECMLLTLVGAGLGGVLSFWGVALLTSLVSRGLPRVETITVNLRVLAFALGLTLLTGLALGLVPALRSGSKNLQAYLKGSRETSGAATQRWQGVFAVLQVALTMILLVGAGLLMRSFYKLLQNDLGFRTESAVVMTLSLPDYESDPEQGKKLRQIYTRINQGEKVADNELPRIEEDANEKRMALFYRQLFDRLQAQPGVTMAGGITDLPLTGDGPDGTFIIDNDPAKKGYADYRRTSPGYFAALGIPLLRGRLFEPTDKAGAEHVAVISQSLARKQWPNEDALGKRIQFGNMDGDLRLLHVVGIVGDVRDQLDQEAQPTVYANSIQRRQPTAFTVVVRGDAQPSTLIAAMRQTLQSLDPEIPATYRTLSQVFSASLNARRFNLVLFGIFAVVALLLAVMGIYSVLAYTVAQQTREIGLRMALGAQRFDVLKLIIAKGMRFTAIGIVIGSAGAWALRQFVASLLYGVTATDSLTFASIASLLAAVALVACWIPARRATKVDPMIALRTE
jgi:putative ABC transport system permease protein